MKYTVIYESATGNTRVMAEAVLAELGETDCVCFTAAADLTEDMKEKVKDSEVIFLGFWTDKGGCSEKIREYMETLHGKKIFLFGTAGFGGSEIYFSQILSRVSEHLGEDNVLVGSYMCQGRMQRSVRGRYEAMLEKNPKDEKIRNMIKNFDEALAHPDEKDVERFRQKIKELKV